MTNGLLTALVAFGLVWAMLVGAMWYSVSQQCKADGGVVVRNMYNMPTCVKANR